MAGTPRGRFAWDELFTSDPGAAGAFHRAVTGWTTEPWDGGEIPYTMWKVGDRAIGGMMELPPEAVDAGAPPHWISYITTPDTGTTVARATELGGTVVWGPKELPEVGVLAGLTDPQGAHFAIIEPSGDAPGHDGPAAVGEVSWHELMTIDQEGAWAFYSELFDWQKDHAMDMGEMGTYQTFGRGAHPLGGIMNKPPAVPVPHWLIYVRVADIDTAIERVEGGGGRILNGPEDVPGGGRIAQCMDPQGAAFALHWRPDA